MQRSGRSIELVTPDKVAAHDCLLTSRTPPARPHSRSESGAAAVSGEATHTRERHHFVYKLLPSRPTFPADKSEAETRIVARHIGY
jgi:hypothetical protein